MVKPFLPLRSLSDQWRTARPRASLFASVFQEIARAQKTTVERKMELCADKLGEASPGCAWMSTRNFTFPHFRWNHSSTSTDKEWTSPIRGVGSFKGNRREENGDDRGREGEREGRDEKLRKAIRRDSSFESTLRRVQPLSRSYQGFMYLGPEAAP